MIKGRIDFSALDPSRDEKRWQGMLESVVEKAMYRREHRLSVGYQLIVWAKPALALAAAAAVALWFGVALLLDRDVEQTDRGDKSTVVLTQLAAGDASYSTYQILNAIGGDYVEN